jgi:hypothetical protein
MEYYRVNNANIWHNEYYIYVFESPIDMTNNDIKINKFKTCKQWHDDIVLLKKK